MTASRSRFKTASSCGKSQHSRTDCCPPVAHDLQRPGEPARVADVVGAEVEHALHGGAYKRRPDASSATASRQQVNGLVDARVRK
jgi:hypothetical protein